jgi:hypothetical protein
LIVVQKVTGHLSRVMRHAQPLFAFRPFIHYGMESSTSIPALKVECIITMLRGQCL